MVRLRNPLDAEENERVAKACATVNREPSMTQQSFAKDCDLNVLVKRFGIHGVPVTPIDPAQFGDISEAPDLRSALEIMRDARERFEAMPARIRNRFDNDPVNFVEFVRDAENREEAIYLGLIEKPREMGSQSPETPPGKTPGEAGSPEGA